MLRPFLIGFGLAAALATAVVTYREREHQAAQRRVAEMLQLSEAELLSNRDALYLLAKSLGDDGNALLALLACLGRRQAACPPAAVAGPSPSPSASVQESPSPSPSPVSQPSPSPSPSAVASTSPGSGLPRNRPDPSSDPGTGYVLRNPPELPPGWIRCEPRTGPYTVVTDDKQRYLGSVAAVISADRARLSDTCALTRRIPAERFRGSRVKLTAALQTERLESAAVPLIRVEGLASKPLGSQGPVTSSSAPGDAGWQLVSTIANVPRGAESIVIGLQLQANGIARWSSVTLETTGTPERDGPARYRLSFDFSPDAHF